MDLTATFSRRRALFALLYLAEGAPIGFLWWALPTLLRQAGTDVERIGALLAVVGLPWTLKMLAAPLVDIARGSGVPLKWILAAAQTAMAGTLAAAALRGDRGLDELQLLLVLHACSAALQDVAIDALCLSVTPLPERGRINGWMQLGFQLGRGAFGGGMLLLAAGSDTAAPFWSLTVVVGAVLAVVLLGVPGRAGGARTVHPVAELRTALAAAARQFVTWRALLFALVAAAGFEAVGALAGPYLVDHGCDTGTIARGYELPKVAAMALGGLLGGRCADRWGPGRAAVRFQLAFVTLVLATAGLDAAGLGGRWPVFVSLVALYFAVGLFTAASYALLMSLTAPRLAATQFSVYMGATNACENWSVLAAGSLVPALGYAPTFALMAAVSLLALPLVPRR